jgi:hypothetical protein
VGGTLLAGGQRCAGREGGGGGGGCMRMGLPALLVVSPLEVGTATGVGADWPRRHCIVCHVSLRVINYIQCE